MLHSKNEQCLSKQTHFFAMYKVKWGHLKVKYDTFIVQFLSPQGYDLDLSNEVLKDFT